MRKVLVGVCVWLLLTAAAQAQPVWTYTIRATPQRLVVEASLNGLNAHEFSVNDDGEPFVHDVQVNAGHGWQTIPRRKTSWFMPHVQACRIRYRYDLAGAARALDAPDTVVQRGPAVVAAPGCYLLRPVRGVDAHIHFTVEGTPFHTGVNPVGPHEWSSHASDLFMGPTSVFGPVSVETVDVPGSRVEVAWLPGCLMLSDHDVVAFVRGKLIQMVRYFDRLPLPHGLVLVMPLPGSRIHGQARGGSGFSVQLQVGQTLNREAVDSDWTFTHEMVHVCTPSLPAAQHWMEEGIATYLEPIVRARSGELTAEKVWHDLVAGLPQGEPGPHDKGLDQTHTWGRTYWGGCMFWLMADLEIRDRTQEKRSLRDALLGMNRRGANIANEWTVDQVLEAGDAATGVPVLHELYRKMAPEPYRIDLDALWQKLGIRMQQDDRVEFYQAPWSSIRDAVTRP